MRLFTGCFYSVEYPLREFMFRRFIYICLLLPCWQFVQAGDTGDTTGATAVPEAGTTTEEGINTEGNELSDEESLECANTVVARLTEGKTPEEIAKMAAELARALKKECQCDQYAVRSMIEIGVPFDIAFNTLVETCELQGEEVGELSRALAPALGGNTGGGPGGGVSP